MVLIKSLPFSGALTKFFIDSGVSEYIGLAMLQESSIFSFNLAW